MKKALSLILALLLCLALAVPSLAAEDSGTCGDNLTYSYSSGSLPSSDGTSTVWSAVLDIQGTGNMEDYDAFHGPKSPWDYYGWEISTIIIGDGVTSIGDYAFYICKSLTSLTIPDSVTSIGDSAFGGCESLSSVTVPDSVTSIGDGAFSSCWKLTGVTIGSGVTTIGNAAFSSCHVLTDVTIPGKVAAIGQNTFSYCTKLTSVTIPSSVTVIDRGAFNDCLNLTDVYYGGSEDQWKQISIGAENEYLRNATIHYNSLMPGAPTGGTSGGTSVTVNGKAVAWTDAEPFIDANDRTMVPLRAVADAMGLDVTWDASAREASFTGGGKTISFPIDSSTARVSGGGTVQMDTAAVIVNERTYAPIRYLAEYFGYGVDWDGAAKTVVITG